MNIAGIGSKVLKYGIKAAGVAGVGMCIYDANHTGHFKSEVRATRAETNSFDYWYDKSRKLTTPSAVNSSLKDKIFQWQLKHNYVRFFNKGIGYVQGFAKQIAEDIVPIGLSIAAIASKGKIAPKVAGGALGLYAIGAFMKNVLNIGVQKDRNMI